MAQPHFYTLLLQKKMPTKFCFLGILIKLKTCVSHSLAILTLKRVSSLECKAMELGKFHNDKTSILSVIDFISRFHRRELNIYHKIYYKDYYLISLFAFH